MEELYRRVSERQTMGSVVDELRTTLGLVEKSLDQFFRSPQDRAPLTEVPSQLAQMRGVFSVLGLDQAAQAVVRMRESVEEIMVTELDEEKARAAGTFDKLGNNMGALGFLMARNTDLREKQFRTGKDQRKTADNLKKSR